MFVLVIDYQESPVRSFGPYRDIEGAIKRAVKYYTDVYIENPDNTQVRLVELAKKLEDFTKTLTVNYYVNVDYREYHISELEE